jgi:hypothetical protein
VTEAKVKNKRKKPKAKEKKEKRGKPTFFVKKLNHHLPPSQRPHVYLDAHLIARQCRADHLVQAREEVIH